MTNNVYDAANQAYVMGQFDVALNYAKKAQSLDKRNLDIATFIAKTCIELGEYNECIKYCRRALRLQKSNASAMCSMGVALGELGKHDEAYRCFNRAVQLDPNDPNCRNNLAIQNFLNGKYSDFKKDYRSRYNIGTNSIPVPKLAPNFAEVKVSDLPSDFSLLIYSEQGIGDEIFFATLFPEFRLQFTNTVYAVCDPRLKKLLSRTYEDIEFYSDQREVLSTKKIDFEMPMGDMMLHLDFCKNDPITTPFVADQKQKFAWQKRIEPLRVNGQAIIGICWRGGGTKRFSINRSLPITDLIKHIPENVQLVNLQYDYSVDELSAAEEQTDRKIWNWDLLDPMYDIDGLANLISNLDAVVTVDNATAHLSGAMNIPTIVALPVNPDFRWKLGKKKSDFYPSIRLIRQNKFRNWDVLEEISSELSEIIANHKCTN